MELDIHYYLKKAKEKQDSGALQAAFSLIKDITATGTTGTCLSVAPELCVLCAEAALQLGCLDITAACLKMYFDGNPPSNQFLCRAYLCQGQLKTPPATGSVEEFEEAATFFLKAIEISKYDSRYHFMAFNASLLYFKIVQPLMQPGRCLHLVSSLSQVVQSLEEVADPDHSWRAELMIHLITCLVDSGKIEDAASFAKSAEEFIKLNAPQLYPRLFRLLVQHNLSASDFLTEMSRQSTSLDLIYKIQQCKKLEIIKGGELEEIFHILVDLKVSTTPIHPSPLQSPIPVHPADRVALLLELALLALQVKHQKVAIDCLKELKTVEEISVGQRIMMECVNCGIHLLKKETKMDEYCKASVEVRLNEICKLDKWLQTAVRERDPQAMQAACATQWSFCLPLLQHNLRKYIKAPLLRVAQVLEDMQSVLLGMRSQIHSELATIEEEEGHLEAALTQIQKAMLLDNGSQRQRLSSAYHNLQLRGMLYKTPSRNEDKAAKLLQQARDMQPQDKTDSRPILVAVGVLLAPDDFQMALDADNISKISPASGPLAQLCAKAQHHAACLEKVDGHLARHGDDSDNTERVKLWATLAKTARKQEVWDVCRAACRFCLLYDHGRWKMCTNKKCKCSGTESCAECLQGCTTQTNLRDLLQLLAEICCISAEATIQKLLTEGLKLNSSAIPPQERGVCVAEDDQQWIIYRDWIRTLSAHATSSFLRAAELGAEIKEPWVVANAAIYLWNYNSHLLAAGEYQHLVPTFQRMVEMLQKTEFTRNHSLVMLLCDAVARGFIQPLCGADNIESTPRADKGKHRAEKGMQKATSVQKISLDPAALQDVHKALELCDYALSISKSNNPGETVPISARKQVVATWVQVKKLLQQQINLKTDIKNKCENENISAMMRVLVGVEMLQCNKNPRHMEFSVPSHSTLVSMASECSWTDAVVELQVWCQLAALCHHVNDHSSVLCCTENGLRLEETATKSLNTLSCALYSLTVVNEMLSSIASLRGLSMAHESNGDLHTYKEALKMLLLGVSYAERADNPALCIKAAKHYWNTCVPLTQIRGERWQLAKPLEKTLTALDRTKPKHTNKQGKSKCLLTLTAMPPGSSKHRAKDEEDLTLRAQIYNFLLQLHIDVSDWKSALQFLDKAIRAVPCTRHRLSLLQQRILVKVQLGESILMDMKMLEDEDKGCCSFMWHQAARRAGSKTQQLTYYQKAIDSCSETQWQKVSLLIEFGAWLYGQNFPMSDARHQVEWAIDILLHLEPQWAEGAEDKNLGLERCEPLVGLQSSSWTQDVSNLKEVWRLDYLMQAHTILALMTEKTSPEHQLQLLRAYTFVFQIWKVSLAVASENVSDLGETQPLIPPQTAGSKKDQDKGRNKKIKEPTPAGEKAKTIVLDISLPSTLVEWARYKCPDQARQIFRSNSNPQCINKHSIQKQTQCLFYLNRLEEQLHSLSLDHLVLPVLHLAETIASELLDSRSLSDLYRLRILRTCCQLGLEACSPYMEKLHDLIRIKEQEHLSCHKVMTSQHRQNLQEAYDQKMGMIENLSVCQEVMNMQVQDIWLDKADVCLSMGLYEPARHLLAEAHLMAKKHGDLKALATCLLRLASLACEEQNHAQALILLEKAQALGGNKEFWYHLSLTKVRAVAQQGNHDAQTKVNGIIKEVCDALKLNMEQWSNHIPELLFMIISLDMRSAMECICAISASEHWQVLCTEAAQRLKAACDTLQKCAIGFTNLGYREQAAEAHVEHAHALRILCTHTTDSDKKHCLLLNGLYQMQLAIKLQEQVVLNAHSLLNPAQEETHGLSLAAARKLLRLRLALAEFCLVMLEMHCAEKKSQAVARMCRSPVKIALEDFMRCTPEPDSLEQEWLSVGCTLGQVALCQLAAVKSHSLINMEIRARCLTLMGKYLRLQAVQDDPIYLDFLWRRNKQKEACCDPISISKEELNTENDKSKESSRREPIMTSAKRAELQQKRHKVQELLSQASKALAEAVKLCLQHNLPSSILADASLDMLECHGQSNPAVAGQHLALFQTCCTVSVIAEVLSSACADTGASQLSALLSLHRKLRLSQEERPSSMLKGVEDSLNSLSKASSHLTVSQSHLNILAELPPNLKILLLQHSEDGSELFGAFYETTKDPQGPKGKTAVMTCSMVAKVSVNPQALLALRKQARTFGQETGPALLKEDWWQGADGSLEVPKEHQEKDSWLKQHFKQIVQDMEDYLKPLLDQFDFTCLRLKTLSVPEMNKTKEKEEKANSAKAVEEQLGTCLVLLADRKLLELPLESLFILQQKDLTSVTRDFSLQLLHSRLKKQEPEKVERDNKKETKGGRGTKTKGDQSQAIKVIPANRVLPSNTFPVDSRNFKYIFNRFNEGNFEEGIEEILNSQSQHFTPTHEGFTGNKLKLSLSQMEQLLCRCSAFIYLGMERFTEHIPPVKLAAFNLSECRMALLFDSTGPLHHSNHHSAGQLALEEPMETALLLSVSGVGCVVLNQWQSSLQRCAHSAATVLNDLMRSRLTSGQAIHALRKTNSSLTPEINESHDRMPLTDSELGDYSAFNCILYGLPNLVVT